MNTLPGLVLDEDGFGYEGKVLLPAWQGFQNRNGAYGAIDSERPSDGTCWIRTGGDLAEDDPIIEDYHVRAFNYLLENQEEIRDNILSSLLEEYPKLQDSYGYEKREKEVYMPDVIGINDFKNLIGIASIHLMNVAKNGQGYIGFEFGCNWDDEHGLGVMTQQNRIVKIGGGDTAFLSWVAEKDLP